MENNSLSYVSPVLTLVHLLQMSTSHYKRVNFQILKSIETSTLVVILLQKIISKDNY